MEGAKPGLGLGMVRHLLSCWFLGLDSGSILGQEEAHRDGV